MWDMIVRSAAPPRRLDVADRCERRLDCPSRVDLECGAARRLGERGGLEHLLLARMHRPAETDLADEPGADTAVSDALLHVADDLVSDALLRRLIEPGRVIIMHVVARAHHDVDAGGTGDAGASERVPAHSDGSGVDDRASAGGAVELQFRDRVFLGQ